MDKKGFTLVEVITVVALLGLIVGLAVPGIMKGNKKAKERTLNNKIKSIEKAAVLYGQDNRDLISRKVTKDDTEYKYCFSEGELISNCYYYEKDGVTTITVEELAIGFDGNTKTDDTYIEFDKDELVLNPVDESKNLNNCVIQIYQKYGKIYAVYDKKYEDINNEDMKCWVD